MGAIFRSYALHERALLALGTRRRVAAHLPVVMYRLDRALRRCPLAQVDQGCDRQDECQQRSHCEKKYSRAERTHSLGASIMRHAFQTGRKAWRMIEAPRL